MRSELSGLIVAWLFEPPSPKCFCCMSLSCKCCSHWLSGFWMLWTAADAIKVSARTHAGGKCLSKLSNYKSEFWWRLPVLFRFWFSYFFCFLTANKPTISTFTHWNRLVQLSIWGLCWLNWISVWNIIWYIEKPAWIEQKIEIEYIVVGRFAQNANTPH